jgi:hypothetical protein
MHASLRWFIVSLLALVVLAAFLYDKFAGSATNDCLLHARAAVVTRDNPMSHAFKWDTDMLAIRNLDNADWTNVEVTIYGTEKYSNGSRKPTGAYKRTKTAVPAKGLAAFSLTELAQPDGGRWVSMTIMPENVDVEALRDGRACTAELPVSTSASDVAGGESR